MKNLTLRLSTITLLFVLVSGSLFAKTNVNTYRIYIKSADAGGGSVNYICHQGDTLSFDFTPASGWRLNTLTLNGTDVTSSLTNGVLTIQGVSSNNALNASFVMVTNNNPPTPGNEVKVYTTPTAIVVDGVDENELITIYSTSGKEIARLKATSTKMNIPAETGIIYILKTNKNTFKVTL